MSNKTWTEDTPVVSPPFLFYRQTEGGPKICIPVLKSAHTSNQGRKYRAMVAARDQYPDAFSFTLVFEDKSEGEYTPAGLPVWKVEDCR
jgi:hypothetical protein